MANVVVCPEWRAAQVGRDVFGSGGNATDAAIAAAFVQGVVNPMLCGIGGSISVYHRDGASGQETFLKAESRLGSRPLPEEWGRDYLGWSPGHRVRLADDVNELGYRAIATPGFVKGCWEAFTRFGSGRLAWSDLLAPAVALARDGVEISPVAYRGWEYVWAADRARGTREKLRTTPEASALFHRPDGARVRPGDRLVQGALADTLHRLAEHGGEDFYTGEIGRRIAEDLDRHGALVTGHDLREYALDRDPPLRGSYRGLRLAAQPFSNGCHVIEMLQILDRFDPVLMGHNSPEYLDLLAKIMRIGWSDYCAVRFAPRAQAAAGEQEIVGQARADYWYERLIAGDPIHVEDDLGVRVPPARGTTHLNAVDDDGHVISLNHSVGVGGSGVVGAGLGFLYNNESQFFTPFPGHRHSFEAGKMFLGGGSPVMVADEAGPLLLAGAPGGTRIVTSLLQVVVNVIDFGMDAQSAVTAPRVHSEYGVTATVEPTMSAALGDALAAGGHTVVTNSYQARPQVLVWDRGRGVVHAGSDPRDGGVGVATWPDHDWAADLRPQLVVDRTDMPGAEVPGAEVAGAEVPEATAKDAAR